MKRLHSLVALHMLIYTFAVQATPPATLNASLSSDGKSLNLHWSSSPGQVQQIQVGADLIHWTNLPPVFLSAFSNSAWSDDGSLTGNLFGSGERFYRLALPPAASGSPGLSYTFLPPDTGTSYSWNFGDGTTSTSNQPSHTFQGDGLYAVTAVVT